MTTAASRQPGLKGQKGLTRAAAGLAALGGALCLAGCGFTPLYGAPGVSSGLSAIEVHVPHGRTAFLLGEDLNDALVRDRATPPLYRLDVMVDERNFQRGLTLNNVATRNEDHITVTYTLTELATGKVIKRGVEPIEVSFASASQPYAGVAAEEDAQKRAADTAADHIRVDLAVYFARR